MLNIKSISAGYGPLEVLHDVSLSVEKGEVVTLIGANGAGKTTTLRAVCGVLKPSQGSVNFEGLDLSAATPEDTVNAGITMIPEGRQLFPFLSVKDNLLMGAHKRLARPMLRRNLADVLDLFPRVAERLTQLAGSLSGGEQQMVAIARGLMSAPKLLIFDEPSLGLAPILVKQVFAIVKQIAANGTTVLIVEQNIHHTLRIASRGYVLEHGAITLADQADALLNNPHVRKAYLGV